VAEGIAASRPGGAHHALRAALWMGGALLSFSIMAIGARELLDTMGTFEILFFRSLVSFLMVVAVLPRYGIAALATRRIALHTIRNVLHFGGQFAWVYAIGVLPLATVFAIEFTMPVWTAVLATALLGERLSRGRAVTLALGLAGILIILRPGFAFIHPAALVMVAGSLCFAATMVATKRLSATDSPLAVLFYMSAIQMPLGLAPALPGWVWPTLADLPWIAAVGGAGFTAHYCITRAFMLADATLVVPIDFLRLPLIAVVGALFYREPVELATMLGAAVIFAGTYYSVTRESRARPRPPREPDGS
jgi:drug/metabolite transporter (DMT)-like permease